MQKPAFVRPRPGRKWIWIGTGIIGGAAAILVVFLLLSRKTDGNTDLKADIREIERLLSKGKSSANYVTKHAPKRLGVWQQAAEAGSPEGQFLLARCYAVGAGVPEDPEQMIAWLRKSADQEFPIAQYYLGVSYHSGAGVAKDQAEVVRWLRKAAERGDSRAQFSLGYCYLSGAGVGKDIAEGARWLRKAADQGDAVAQSELAAQHWSGQAKDKGEAFRYSRLAAEQELAVAQLQVGICYATGDGVPKDAAQAAQWFQKAAEQGNTLAQTCLASCYASGGGAAQDWTKAVELYERAAKGGNAAAMNNLGHCYENGQGAPKDPAKAAAWYWKGSKTGDPAAMYNVGLCYAAGKGVVKDVTLAKEWLDKSAKADYEPARQQVASAGAGGPVASDPSFFNGQDLTGWEGLPGYWKVLDGAIIGAPAGGVKAHTFLCSQQKYKDFELRFKVRRKDGIGNSGVQFRSVLVNRERFQVRGPQLEIESAGSRSPPGSVVTEPSGPVVKASANAIRVWRDADFNDMTIRCIGKHVTVTVNGVVAVDVHHPSMPGEGIIAWQLHGGYGDFLPTTEVVFKDIQFTNLGGVLLAESSLWHGAHGPPNTRALSREQVLGGIAAIAFLGYVLYGTQSDHRRPDSGNFQNRQPPDSGAFLRDRDEKEKADAQKAVINNAALDAQFQGMFAQVPP